MNPSQSWPSHRPNDTLAFAVAEPDLSVSTVASATFRCTNSS